MENEPSEKEQLQATLRARLCVCGAYKHARASCCPSCWHFLPEDLIQRLFAAGYGLSYDDPVSVEVREALAPQVEYLNKCRADGYESTVKGESEKDRYFRLKFIANRGVKLRYDDMAFFLEHKKEGRDAGQYVAMGRNAVQGIMSNATIVHRG